MLVSSAAAGPAAGPAGVRNLRAMFENKSNDHSSNSPPSRGRSPNGSISSHNSRPVSKVRTSFVAVERPGEAGQPVQVGLRKTSDVSSMAEVREEAIVEAPSSTVANTAGNDLCAPTIMDGHDLGAILKGSPFESPVSSQPDLTAVSEKPKTEAKVEEKSPEKSKPKPTRSASKVATVIGKMQPEDQATVAPSSTQPKPSKPVPAALNTTATASKPKTSPTIPKKSPALQKKTQDHITTNGHGPAIKPRGGVHKITGVMQSANKAREERAKAAEAKREPTKDEKKTTTRDVKPPSVASKPTAASKAHAQRQESGSADATQIRSPTTSRPTKLPSAATATTAASAAKRGTTTEAEAHNKHHAAERKSTVASAPRVANTSTRASLAKKSSRASLAANGEDQTRSRLSITHKPADENFLARMTRPTASSAQKAHGKIEVSSPPRPRRTSGAHDLPKKPGRKSLNTNAAEQDSMKPAGSHEPADDAVLEPVNEAKQQTPATASEEHEGEPESVEENDDPVPPQQAVVLGASSA